MALPGWLPLPRHGRRRLAPRLNGPANEVRIDSLLAVYQDTYVRHDASRLLQAIVTLAVYIS